jgi:hypothetical protein
VPRNILKLCSYSKEAHKGATGVLLVDKLGLPVMSTGNLDTAQSGLLSSIMKNASRLHTLLSNPSDSAAEGGEESQLKQGG